jgi:hypothetical protein
MKLVVKAKVGMKYLDYDSEGPREDLGWKGKKVRNILDGRQGIISQEGTPLIYLDLYFKLSDGSKASIKLKDGELYNSERGWQWYCENFDGGPRWLDF